MNGTFSVNALLKKLVNVALTGEDVDATEMMLESAEAMMHADPGSYVDLFAAVAALKQRVKMYALFLGDDEFETVMSFYGMMQDKAVFNLKLATFKMLQNAVGVSVRSRTGYLF